MPKSREVIYLKLELKLANIEIWALEVFKKHGLPRFTMADASLLVNSRSYKGKKLSNAVLTAIVTYTALPLVRKHIASREVDAAVLSALNIAADLAIVHNTIMNTKLDKITQLPSTRAKKQWSQDKQRRKDIDSKQQKVITDAEDLLAKDPPVLMRHLCRDVLMTNPNYTIKQIRNILKAAGVYVNPSKQ